MHASVLWLLLEKAIRVFSGVFVATAVARHLGPADYGLLALAVGITGVAVAAASMGADHTNLSELIKDDSRDQLIAILLCRVVMAIACSAVVVTYAWLTSGEQRSLLTILALTVVATAPVVFVHKLYALGRFSIAGLLGVLAILIAIALRLSGIAMSFEAEWFAWCIAIEAMLIGLLPLAWLVMNAGDKRISIRFQQDRIAQYLRLCAPLMGAAILVAVYFRLEILIVGYLLGAEAAGTWAAAMMFVMPWGMASAAVLPVVNRRLVHALKLAHTDYRAEMIKLIRWMGLAAIGAVCFNVVAIRFAAPMLLGEAFESVIGIASVASMAILPLFMGAVQDLWLAQQRQSKVVLRKVLIGIPLSSVLLLIGTHFGGLIGTAMAVVLSYLTTAVVLNARLDRDFFELQLASVGLRHAR